MYTEYFGLKETPFDLSPDPKFLYLGDSHKEAFAHLKSAVKERKQFIIMTGEVGTGKTTLLNGLLEEIDPEVKRVHLTNPGLTVEDLFHMVWKSMDLPMDDASEGRFFSALDDFVKNSVPENEQILLIIDEAQDLSTAALEGVYLLSNMETSGRQLFQILLVGRPELNIKSQTTESNQLWQRIDARYNLSPLNRRDTIEYVKHRLEVAGYKGRGLFHRKAIKEIHKSTEGYPRLINILCDHALFTAYSRNLKEITRGVIKESIKDIKVSDAVPQKRSYTKAAMAMILVFSLSGLGYALYRNGGVEEGVPPPSPFQIHRESKDNNVMLVQKPEKTARDQQMKVTKREIPLISATKKKVVLHSVAKKADLATADSYRWTVQVSSCQSFASAQRVRNQLKRKGFPVYLTEVTLGGKTWHRVRIGFYGTRTKAHQIGKMIKSNFNIKEYLVVRLTDDEKSAGSQGNDP